MGLAALAAAASAAVNRIPASKYVPFGAYLFGRVPVVLA
jgi:hypothetical protein